MANTPPPPQPAPVPDQQEDGSQSGHGGLDRDMNALLANLNPEQLASIVAAAKASEGGEVSGVDSDTIAANLPSGLEGQAASALTALNATSAKSEKDAQAGENGESDAAHGNASNEAGTAGKAHPNGTADVDGKDESMTDIGGETTRFLADETAPTEGQDSEYSHEHATAAAIAAMESLAGQSTSERKGRAKRESGPEAERVRKDQHKEVERKRREQISSGITSLANIVPGCDTKGINKTAIINAAVRYIVELKNNEASNIEKWTLEKLLMDQALADRDSENGRLREQNRDFRAKLGLPEEEPEEPTTAPIEDVVEQASADAEMQGAQAEAPSAKVEQNVEEHAAAADAAAVPPTGLEQVADAAATASASAATQDGLVADAAEDEAASKQAGRRKAVAEPVGARAKRVRA